MAPPLKQPNTERRSREYLTPAELDRLMAAARHLGRHGHRDATMILVAYRHGLRVSELCAASRWIFARDCCMCAYDQPIVLNRRQAGPAIEGALRQRQVDQLDRDAVDTHGFTHFAMALAKIVGFDLCPRLAKLKHRKLYLPKGLEVPPILRPIVAETVSRRTIGRGWDGLLRLGASGHLEKSRCPVLIEWIISGLRWSHGPQMAFFEVPFSQAWLVFGDRCSRPVRFSRPRRSGSRQWRRARQVAPDSLSL